MTCCGKIKNAINTGKQIVEGSVNLALEKKYEFTDGRIRVCRGCEMSTWMTRLEFIKAVAKNGLLPKQEQSKERKHIHCRDCKCDIPRKARKKDAECPLDKWPDNKGIMKNK